MIQVRCPACGRTFRAADEHAGKRATCPKCGGELRIPNEERARAVELVEVDEQTTRGAGMRQCEGERELWRSVPSHVVYFPLYALGGVLVLLFGVGLLVLGFAVLHRRSIRYWITTRRVGARQGIVGKAQCELALKDIRNVFVHVGPLERLFGVGTVAIGTAATSKLELRLIGVRNPDAVRDLIVRSMEDPTFGSS